uniref:YEATS domain-containing protein n=1 Tax=Meloidogyne incognita TaxID=6306 RepID=A0A914KVP5_MELIC
MSNSSLSAPSIGTNTSPQSRSLVRLLIGNVSKFLPEKTSTDFTHKWTVYVRAVGPEQFTDRSFIRKIVFRLHESFTNPEREVSNPPFEVSECGFGSFDMVITIYFAGQKKSYKINYNLDLLLGSDHKNEAEYKIEVINPSPEFASLVPKYCRPQTKQKLPSRPSPALFPSNPDNCTVTKQSKSSTNKEISTAKSSKSKDEKKEHKHQSSSKNSLKISKKDVEVKNEENSPIKQLKKEEGKELDGKEKNLIIEGSNKKKKTTPVTAPKKRIQASTDCESDSAIRDLFEANLPSTSKDSSQKEEKTKEIIEKNIVKTSKDGVISNYSEDKKEKNKKDKVKKDKEVKKEEKQNSKKKENENKLIVENEKERHINSPKKVLTEKPKGNGEEVKKLKLEETILSKRDKEEKKSSKDEKKNEENEEKEKKKENKNEKIKIKISEIDHKINEKINIKININKQQSNNEKDKKQKNNNNIEVANEKGQELLKEKKEEINKEKELKRKKKEELKKDKEENSEKRIKTEKKKKDKENDKKSEEKLDDVDSFKINKISEKKANIENFVQKQSDEIGGIEEIKKSEGEKPNSSKDKLTIEEPKRQILSPKLVKIKQTAKQTPPTANEKIQERDISPSIFPSLEVKKRKSDNTVEDSTKIEKKKVIENKRKYLSSSSSSSPIRPPKIPKDGNFKTIEPTKIKSFEQIKREIRKEKTPSPKTSTSFVEETPVKIESQENDEEEFPVSSSQQTDGVNKIEEFNEDSSNFVPINRIDILRRKLDSLQEKNAFGDENIEGGEVEELLFKCCELLLEQKTEGTLLNIEEKNVSFDFEKIPETTLNDLENLLVGVAV